VDIFALIVILVTIAAAIWIVVTLGSLPGRIARERRHYQAEAIAILGWIGILTLGISWFIAIVWAYTRPFSAEAAELKQRVEELEAKLAASSEEESAR
jgi:hypothetical protein